MSEPSTEELALEAAQTAAAERDRLATDALDALAAARVTTPEKGYVAEPHCLSGDIEKLARSRDVALLRAAHLASYLTRLIGAMRKAHSITPAIAPIVLETKAIIGSPSAPEHWLAEKMKEARETGRADAIAEIKRNYHVIPAGKLGDHDAIIEDRAIEAVAQTVESFYPKSFWRRLFGGPTHPFVIARAVRAMKHERPEVNA